MISHKAVQLALRAPLLALSTLPGARAWENEAFVPTTGVPHIDEMYQPLTTQLKGLTRGGSVLTTGLYRIRWWGLERTSITLSDNVDTVLALYPPGAAFTATDGTVVRVRGEPVGPTRSQLLPVNGWAVITVTVPFWIQSLNPA